MLSRSIQWFCLTIAILSATTLAQDSSSQNSCNWCSWVEGRLDALEAKWAEYFKPGGSNDGTTATNLLQSSQGATSSTLRYSSTFGTPIVTTSAPAVSTDPTWTSSSPVVTVSTTSQAAGNPAPSSSNSVVTISTTSPVAAPTGVAPRDGYRAIGYFGNWDIYARKFFPYNIPADKLTHVLYSFADNREDGTVFFTDTWADTDIHYANDSWNDIGNNVYGAMKQLSLLKAKNRNMKVMLSIGGWTYTNTNKHMDVPASTAAGRQTFANSCVAMIRDYGFDGIDIDWEYPQNPTQGGQLLDLLKAIRQAMDTYANTLTYTDANGVSQTPHFELSIAAPAGESNYKNMPLGEISQVVDFINLMAYDYAGSWEANSAHAQNLYKSASNPKSTPFSTFDTVQGYFNANVAPAKINLGMPIYGRSFTNTQGIGTPFNGIGQGSWEAGVYDWKALPLPGATVYYDQEAGATYSYNNATGELVSYDTLDMALKKTQWLMQTGLGGAMWWELASDKYDGSGLVENVVKALGSVEQKGNWLRYPDSRFDNIKAMGSS